MISFTGIGKRYANETQALQDINLTVADGEILAILGGSGCGKSTLLRLASGLDHPTAGTVTLDGALISEPHPAIGVVFQEPRLLPWLKISDNVGFGLGDLDEATRRERVRRALDRIGLANYGDAWPRELSGGQAQRVALARGLVPQPKVLLLDEPFSALDPFTRASLQEALLSLWAAQKPTLIIVTHDVEEAIVLADRIAVMRPSPGRIFADIKVDLPRPRERLSDDFIALERRILRALDGSLSDDGGQDKSRAVDEAAAAAAHWW
jgi:sulfonate transport system ATP-binding protein